ncbi:helix-turn-helix domain-containing protein [Anaerophilus nitritogenes]|uniref:helix-turn-helix domain-containing protein n=1 Tax=Anaerophilus nitritogenes TaxID=2498136 RepID=UPI00101D6C0F|nr:helix-turn-helix domain-containing protein [Anaerophilus nitritogenes]
MENKKKNFRDILKVEGVKARGFGIIPKLVMLDRKLTIEAKAIYSYFCSYAGAGTTAFPSRDKICKDLGISIKRWYKHFNLLKELGYIKVEQIRSKKGDKYSHNIYTLIEKPETIENTEDDQCGQNEYTRNEHTQNDYNNNNRSFNKNNKILYNHQSVIAEPENGQTDIKNKREEIKEEIISNAEIYLYKGQARELLEKTITKLLECKKIQVNNKLLNNQQILEQLQKLTLNMIDYTFSKFRQVQEEKTIKNKQKYFEVLLLSCIDEYAANSIF